MLPIYKVGEVIEVPDVIALQFKPSAFFSKIAQYVFNVGERIPEARRLCCLRRTLAPSHSATP